MCRVLHLFGASSWLGTGSITNASCIGYGVRYKSWINLSACDPYYRIGNNGLLNKVVSNCHLDGARYQVVLQRHG